MDLTDEQKDKVVIRTLVIMTITLLIILMLSITSTTITLIVILKYDDEPIELEIQQPDIVNIEDMVSSLSISYMIGDSIYNNSTYVFNMNSPNLDYGQEYDTLNDTTQSFYFGVNLDFLEYDFTLENSLCVINRATIELNTSLVDNIYSYSYVFGITFHKKSSTKIGSYICKGNDKLDSTINVEYQNIELSDDCIHVGAFLLVFYTK